MDRTSSHKGAFLRLHWHQSSSALTFHSFIISLHLFPCLLILFPVYISVIQNLSCSPAHCIAIMTAPSRCDQCCSFRNAVLTTASVGMLQPTTSKVISPLLPLAAFGTSSRGCATNGCTQLQQRTSHYLGSGCCMVSSGCCCTTRQKCALHSGAPFSGCRLCRPISRPFSRSVSKGEWAW